MKDFEEFLIEGVVVRISKDLQRAKSLALESERKFNSLKEQIEKIGIRDDNANDFVENCYDIIMYLIRAKLFVEGFASSGKGAHEAEVAYLRRLGISESQIKMVDDLRYYRNGILYYGKRFDKEYAENVVDFTKKLFVVLKKFLAF